MVPGPNTRPREGAHPRAREGAPIDSAYFWDVEGAPARTRGRGRFWVYARTGAPCPRCGAVIQHDRLAGRDLYWCPACQQQ
ncbi:zinc finger domain-containing protein [Auritidibacter ignavus]|uniref:zinc finger domain-containing protein n=1 Tax=Auritidibacter ignavus TaxID=678932 RepID=UPI0031452562